MIGILFAMQCLPVSALEAESVQVDTVLGTQDDQQEEMSGRTLEESTDIIEETKNEVESLETTISDESLAVMETTEETQVTETVQDVEISDTEETLDTEDVILVEDELPVLPGEIVPEEGISIPDFVPSLYSNDQSLTSIISNELDVPVGYSANFNGSALTVSAYGDLVKILTVYTNTSTGAGVQSPVIFPQGGEYTKTFDLKGKTAGMYRMVLYKYNASANNYISFSNFYFYFNGTTGYFDGLGKSTEEAAYRAQLDEYLLPEATNLIPTYYYTTYSGSSYYALDVMDDILAKAKELTVGAVTDEQKVRAVHDWMCDEFAYDYDALSTGNIQNQATPSWVFKNKRAVCSGFSRLNQLMLTSLGVPCISVMGAGSGVVNGSTAMNHEWNLVYIEGQWRELDVTWDCKNNYQNGTVTKGTRDYTYYGQDPVLFGQSHYSLYMQLCESIENTGFYMDGGYLAFKMLDRSKRTGWLDAQGGLYWFDNNGHMPLGWKEMDGKYYYFEQRTEDNPGGAYRNITVELDGATCTFDSDGALVGDYPFNVTSVSLNKTSATLTTKNQTLELIAAVEPEWAKEKGVIWSTSNSKAATVNDGVVTAVANGTAVIKATTVDGGFYATCTVNVNIPTVVTNVTGVSLDKHNISMTRSGEQQTLTASIIPTNAANKNVTWKSNNTSVATVNSNGVVTAVGNGIAWITVTTADGGKTDSCQVVVNLPIDITGFTLKEGSVTLTSKGEAKTLTPVITPTNATDQRVTWESNNTSVAAVNASGVVTAVANGSAVITATTVDGGLSARCSVLVKIPEPLPIKVSGIKLNMTTVNLEKIGDIKTLTAAVSPSNAANRAVQWSSSNPLAVQVDASGKLTAKAAGTAIITCMAADGSGKKAICNVKVYSKVEQFVNRLYNNVLNRSCEAAGLKMWNDELISHKKSGAEVADGFVFSEEFENRHLSDEDYVEMLYKTFLGRSADAGGKKTWLSKLSQGMSRRWVFKGFAESGEFTAICKDYGITRGNVTLTEYRDKNEGVTTFVYRCYDKALGRKADVGGLNNWCQILIEKRQTPEEVAKGFIFSPEMNEKNLSNTEFVKVLYRVFMGREYDQAGLNTWVNNLNNHTSRESVFEGFAYSNEFKVIVASYGL